jgi:hypothetical protein
MWHDHVARRHQNMLMYCVADLLRTERASGFITMEAVSLFATTIVPQYAIPE